MALHILKLAVGIENIGHLRDVQARRLAENGDLRHVTRFMPRRAEQVLEGGSLYWVVRNIIRVRQRLLDLKLVTENESGGTKCAFILDPELILTIPVRRRPHQGWRYFEADSVPPDLGTSLQEYADMPPEMMADLRALGLI
ncbi:MAG: DUF1489 domain-containing protein [Rhodospirillaceae bacterium]|nr:DUF1489 domain-containing protein [Rhodospirillaceae bacterium]MBT3928118.1 DUF1489 domain-containing protein [Rhodospirillaceae bacterium]MBT5039883.1 DUF1489 domain-containing protein [Rhodospirillaceae bacterium]MBT5780794.1 DUF1489 domain-containing protein [Rhodospirillaceae bacterium]MBT7290885.1 DUF1489 domain-containing protein [Rhodospirillaceae bacterium]